MGFLTILPGLLALAGFSLALVRFTRLSAGLAPLACLSSVLLLLLLAGMGGILPAVTFFLLALGVILFAAEVSRRVWPCVQKKPSAKAIGTALAVSARGVSPAALLFWAGAVLLALRLAWLQPEFSAFDEYSFWGTAARLTTLNEKLYTACASGVPWQMTQTASLPLVSWWFQPFGSFAAWRTIFAGDTVILAGLAAAASCTEKAGRRVWAPLCLVLLLVPTAFAATGHMSVLCTAWLEFMGDIPAGILFGAAVAFWLAVREKGVCRWFLLPILCLAANIKSNTFVLALAAAGCIAADVLLFADNTVKKSAKGFLGRLAFAAACFAAPAAQYMLWSRYTAGLVAQNAASGGLGDTANVTLPEVVVNGIKILLGGIGDNYFEWHRQDLFDYAVAMRSAFFHKSVSIFGAGIVVCILIGAVFLLAVLLAPTMREKLRAMLLALCSTACFGGYWLMLLLSYAFLMKDSTPEALVSYARYFSSYYIGWMLLALAVLGRQAARRPNLAARGGALALACLSAVLTLVCLEPQFTVLGVGRGTYAQIRAEYSVAQAAAAQLSPQDSLFLIYQGDQGQKWFLYEYAFLPQILQYGAGGGTYGDPALGEGLPYFQPYTRDAFSQLVADSGADYLLIVKSDETFVQSYADLFTDGLSAAQEGSPVIYRVSPSGYTFFCRLEQGALA